MTVSVKDRKLLMYCFACGAKGDSVVESIGLSTSALFEDSQEFDADPHYLLKKTQEDDDFLIAIYQSAKRSGERIRYKDHKAYMEAMARRQNRTEAGIAQTIIPETREDFLYGSSPDWHSDISTGSEVWLDLKEYSPMRRLKRSKSLLRY